MAKTSASKEANTNLSIYESTRQVPETAKKTIKGGKLSGMTDINPMWRIKTLTDLFGPCGRGWKLVTKEQKVVEFAGEAMVHTEVELFVKFDGVDGSWSDPIVGVGGSKLFGKGQGDQMNDEAFKMSYTDAISVACKNLGMAADVYFAKDADYGTKYEPRVNVPQGDPFKSAPVQRQTRTQAPAPQQAPQPAPEAPQVQTTPPKVLNTPCSEAIYKQLVEAEAINRPLKTGEACRAYFIRVYTPSADAIRAFDNAVETVRQTSNNQ